MECLWLHGKRVLLLKRLSDGSAEIADKGLVVKIGPQLTRELQATGSPAPKPQPKRREPTPFELFERDVQALLRSQQQMIVKRRTCMRSLAKELGLPLELADKVQAQVMGAVALNKEPRPTFDKRREQAEPEVVDRFKAGDSLPQIADAVGRGTGFVKSVLTGFGEREYGERLSVRELGFRLGRDQLDRNKLPRNEHRSTQRSAEHVARNKARRLHGAAKRAELRRNIDELLAQVHEAHASGRYRYLQEQKVAA